MVSAKPGGRPRSVEHSPSSPRLPLPLCKKPPSPHEIVCTINVCVLHNRILCENRFRRLSPKRVNPRCRRARELLVSIVHLPISISLVAQIFCHLCSIAGSCDERLGPMKQQQVMPRQLWGRQAKKVHGRSLGCQKVPLVARRKSAMFVEQEASQSIPPRRRIFRTAGAALGFCSFCCCSCVTLMPERCLIMRDQLRAQQRHATRHSRAPTAPLFRR